MKNILVAIDFSNVSEEVVKKGAEMAKAFSSHLWIVHVGAPNPDFIGYEAGPRHERDWRTETLHQEHRTMQDKAKEVEKYGIKATPLLVQGPTIESILKEASRLKAELIVVGSHGHGVLHDVLVGSVTKGLLRRSPHPLLVIPAQKKKTIVLDCS